MKMSRAAFDKLVERAIAALPAEFAQWLDDVPVIVDDRPAKELAIEDDTLGLFVGRSMAERSVDDSASIPPTIHLFRIPLMDSCETRRQLAEEIRKTLLHELGHYAGMDEDDLEDLGYGDMDDPIDFDLDE